MPAVDITHLFKACVMTIKLECNSLAPKDKTKAIGPEDKHRILRKTPRDEFSRQAKDVCNKITNIRNLLLENRPAYMRIGQHLRNAAQMTDEQRNVIDRESEKFFSYYQQHLAQMRADWKHDKRKDKGRHSRQLQEHMENVLELLSAYLKSVQQLHIEQKKYRVQHELETYRLLKLMPDKSNIPKRYGGERVRAVAQRTAAEMSSGDDEEEDVQTESTSASDLEANEEDWLDLQKRDIPQSSPRPPVKQERQVKQQQPQELAAVDSKLKVALDEDTAAAQRSQQEAHKLSPDELQLLEAENLHLLQELQGVTDEVQQIEKNVVDIATLQDIFTEKVSLQQHHIERITNAVVGATENVKDANEQILEAIQRNADMRAWSLFFLVVMSFALLFLDWYYD